MYTFIDTVFSGTTLDLFVDVSLKGLLLPHRNSFCTLNNLLRLVKDSVAMGWHIM